jgi:hypothetical protein
MAEFPRTALRKRERERSGVRCDDVDNIGPHTARIQISFKSAKIYS